MYTVSPLNDDNWENKSNKRFIPMLPQNSHEFLQLTNGIASALIFVGTFVCVRIKFFTSEVLGF